MGVNQVQGTELYLGELNGKIGITPLDFTEFPFATTSSTYSATNGVTDSAAGGTALATGKKTKTESSVWKRPADAYQKHRHAG